jgi:hypothetical protein
MVKINTFFSEKYSAHTHLMKLVVLMLGIILLLAILNNKYILPRPVFIVLSAITCIVFLFLIVRKWIDYSKRNNYNFNKYDHDDADFVNDSPTTTTESQKLANNKKFEELKKGGLGMKASAEPSCMGKECCSSDTRWDKIKKKCVEITGGTADPEAMTTMQRNQVERLQNLSGGENEKGMLSIETFNSGTPYSMY